MTPQLHRFLKTTTTALMLLTTSQTAFSMNLVDNPYQENPTIHSSLAHHNSETVKLLTLDGGGIRGIIELVQLAALEKTTGQQCHEIFDVFAGTSTGGIIAAALSLGIKAEDILHLYMKCGPEIFKRSMWNEVDSNGLSGTQFDKQFIEEILIKLTKKEDGTLYKFNSTSGIDLKKRLFLTAYDMHNKRGLLFDSEKAGVQMNDLYTILRATSAAPSYFDPATVMYEGSELTNCVDGGLYQNNPTLLVTEELTKEDRLEIENKKKNAIHRNLNIYSLGTGNTSAIPCEIDFNNRSSLTLIPHLLESLFNSSSISVHNSLTLKRQENLFDKPNRLSINLYYRNQPDLTDKKSHEMSDTSLEATSLLFQVGNTQILSQNGQASALSNLLISLGFTGEKYSQNVIDTHSHSIIEKLESIDLIDGTKANPDLYFYGLINDYVLQHDDKIRADYLKKTKYNNENIFKNDKIHLDNFEINDLLNIKVLIDNFRTYTKSHDDRKSIGSVIKNTINKISLGYICSESKHLELETELKKISNLINIEIKKSPDSYLTLIHDSHLEDIVVEFCSGEEAQNKFNDLLSILKKDNPDQTYLDKLKIWKDKLQKTCNDHNAEKSGTSKLKSWFVKGNHETLTDLLTGLDTWIEETQKTLDNN